MGQASHRATNNRLARVHQRLNDIQNEIKFMMHDGTASENNNNNLMMASMNSDGEGAATAKYNFSQLQTDNNSTQAET